MKISNLSEITSVLVTGINDVTDTSRDPRASLLLAKGDTLDFLAHLGYLVMGEKDLLAPLVLQGLVDPKDLVQVRLSHLV